MKWFLSEDDKYYIVLGNIRIPVICILLLFTFILRLLLLSGMAQGDDLQYAAIANRIHHGIRIPDLYIFDLRWFVVLPTVLMYKLFGISDFSSLFFPTILSVLSVYFAWAIINDLTDSMTALITAAFYAVFPLVSIYGTFLQVAVFLEFAFLLTIYLFLRAVNKNKLSGFVYTGLAASLIPMARMSGVLIFVLLFFYLLYMKLKDQKLCLDTVKSVCVCFIVFILFSLTLLVVQGIVYAFIYDDFFYRLEVSQKAIALQNATTGMDSKDFLFYVLALFKKQDFYNCDYFGYFGYILFPAILYCLFKGIKTSYVIIAWYLGLSVLITIAPSSLWPYTPLIRNVRYMIVLVLPLVTVCVIAIKNLAYSRGIYGKTLAAFLFFMLPLTSIINNIEISATYKKIAQEERLWTKDVLALSKMENSTAYATDMDFPRWYGYYSGYEKENLRYLKRLDYIKQPGVLFLQKGVHKDRYFLNEKERNFLWRHIPDDWKVLKEYNGKRLFKVFPVNSLEFDISMKKLFIGKPYNLDLLSFDVKTYEGVNLVDQDMGGFGNMWQHDNHLFIGAKQAGGEVIIELTADTQSEKDLTIGFTKAPDFGVIDVFLNNNLVLHNFDLYHDVVVLEKKHIDSVILNKGGNVVRFVITGKNSLSSNYRAGIDYIELN